jgi:hypothetical protein
VAGFGAAAIVLASCATTISGSAAPVDASNSSYSAPVHTVADLGAAVSHNTTQANSVHMDMTMTLPGVGGITATGDAKFARNQPAEQMAMTIPSVGKVKIVLVSGTIYLALPPSIAGVLNTSGKPWVKVDLTGVDPQFQSLGQTANLAGQADPTQLIQQISAAGTITNVSHETVNGVATTHYSISVDVSKLLRSANANAQEQQELAQLGITTLPFDIWVNGDNLPIRIVTKIPFPATTSMSPGQPVSITVNYSDWGRPVTITAPPADQVAPLGGN